MLKWLRTRASTVAAAALVSLVAMGFAELRPHAPDCHDRDCAEAFLAPSDAAGPRFTGASPGGSDTHEGVHCAGCHLSRSFRTRPQVAAFHAPPPDCTSRPHLVAFQLRPAPSLAQPSLRAPPSPVHA